MYDAQPYKPLDVGNTHLSMFDEAISDLDQMDQAVVAQH